MNFLSIFIFTPTACPVGGWNKPKLYTLTDAAASLIE